MKEISVQEEFIRLRAEGCSLAKISEQLNTSKPTLIKWHREFESEINNLRYEAFESLISEHKLAKQCRVQTFAKTLQRLFAELETRDLSKVSDKHLLQMILALDDKIRLETKEIHHGTGEFRDSFGMAL